MKKVDVLSFRHTREQTVDVGHEPQVVDKSLADVKVYGETGQSVRAADIDGVVIRASSGPNGVQVATPPYILDVDAETGTVQFIDSQGSAKLTSMPDGDNTWKYPDINGGDVVEDAPVNEKILHGDDMQVTPTNNGVSAIQRDDEGNQALYLKGFRSPVLGDFEMSGAQASIGGMTDLIIMPDASNLETPAGITVDTLLPVEGGPADQQPEIIFQDRNNRGTEGSIRRVNTMIPGIEGEDPKIISQLVAGMQVDGGHFVSSIEREPDGSLKLGLRMKDGDGYEIRLPAVEQVDPTNSEATPDSPPQSQQKIANLIEDFLIEDGIQVRINNVASINRDTEDRPLGVSVTTVDKDYPEQPPRHETESYLLRGDHPGRIELVREVTIGDQTTIETFTLGGSV